MRSTSRFNRGAGAWECGFCGRLTRGGEGEVMQVCRLCFEIGGIENSIIDGCATPSMVSYGVDLYYALQSKQPPMLPDFHHLRGEAERLGIAM